MNIKSYIFLFKISGQILCFVKSTDRDGNGVEERFLKVGIEEDSGEIGPGFDFTAINR